MNDDLMQVWVEEIWIKHTQAKCKRLGFQRSMLTFDAFAAHLSDGVEKQLLESNTNTQPYQPVVLQNASHGCFPNHLKQS